MISSKSPLDVLVAAWKLGRHCLPEYSHANSRKDFTQSEMFACLALRHFYNLSYRGVAGLLLDSPDWCMAIDMDKPPNFRTLSDAFDRVATHEGFECMLDKLTADFAASGLLDFDGKPLAIDSTHYESHHVSRHYEKRKHKADRARKDGETPDKQGSVTRSQTVRKLPKLAIAVMASCHFVLSAWAGTGMGSDHGHFEGLLMDAWTRAPVTAPVTAVVADAGYDSEDNHRIARLDMGIQSIIPPLKGRPGVSDPDKAYRQHMREAFADGSAQPAYGQRWQAETVNSMMKRNYGSSLRAATPERRERELLLKVVVHNLALKIDRPNHS